VPWASKFAGCPPAWAPRRLQLLAADDDPALRGGGRGVPGQGRDPDLRRAGDDRDGNAGVELGRRDHLEVVDAQRPGVGHFLDQVERGDGAVFLAHVAGKLDRRAGVRAVDVDDQVDRAVLVEFDSGNLSVRWARHA
jgi:hypothetical protein